MIQRQSLRFGFEGLSVTALRRSSAKLQPAGCTQSHGIQQMVAIWNAARVLLMALIIVIVGELSARFPKAGAIILSLPIVSILAILVGWQQHRRLEPLSTLARETLILVPLGLPFFLPLAFASRIGIGFWTAVVSGVALASATILTYLYASSST